MNGKGERKKRKEVKEREIPKILREWDCLCVGVEGDREVAFSKCERANGIK